MFDRQLARRAAASAAAIVLIAGATLSAVAATTIMGSTTDKTTVPVYATYDEVVYSVGLEWGSMEFHYQYGTGWSVENEGDNKIALTNYSTAPVAAELKFTGTATKYTGSFNTKADGAGEAYQVLYMDGIEGDMGPEGALYLQLDDSAAPDWDADRRKIGDITIRLLDTRQNNGGNWVDSYDPGSIGKLTQNSEITVYDQNE